MKKRTFLKEQLEPGRGREQKLKTKLASLALVGTLIAGGATNGTAQELKTQEKREDSKEIVVQAPDTLATLEDAIKLPGIEPYPEGADTEEPEPVDGGSDSVKEQESPTKFTISTGLGYSIGGKTYMSNRIAGSGQLFKGTKGELNAYAHIDYDDPMHSTGSGKVTLGKTIYKGLSLDGDYTFTGTGGNVVRLGLGYGGKIGEGQYTIKVFPLNTNGSPIAVKVSLGTRVGENGELSSFVFVDFGDNSYYGETEYAHKIAKGIALFAQARYGGIVDGKFTGTDFQKLVGGIKIDIK